MYVVNADSDSVTVIDTVTNRIVDTIDVGEELGAGVLDAKGRRLYVPLWGIDRVAIIDTRETEVVDTIRVGDFPENLIVDSARRQLFVPNAMSGTVSVVDMRTDRVVKTIDLATAPGVPVSSGRPGIVPAPVLDAARGLLYLVAFTVTGALQGLESQAIVIDARSHEFVSTIPVGSAATPLMGRVLALDLERLLLYVANRGSDTVSVVDTSTNQLLATIDVPAGVLGNMAYDGAAQRLYLADRRDALAVISTRSNTIIDYIATGFDPEPLVDPAAMRLYVTSGDGYVVVLESQTYRRLGSIDLGGWPQTPVLNPSTGLMYVPIWAEGESDTLVVIDTRHYSS